MMFESEDVSYRVSEFFEKFKNEFPKLVMVTQGFYGENVTDTFDRDQVIRIHTYSSQRRVVAVTLEETDRKLGHYSIPMDYPLKFCIKKGSKLKGNKEFSLGEIIAKNKLPVEVQFAKNEKVTMGPKSCSTSNFPVLRLTHTFDEVYMLGNFINNGIAVYANPVTEDTIYEKLQPDLYAEPYDFLRYQMVEMKSSGLGKDTSIPSSSVEKVTEELKHTLKPSTQNRPRVLDISKRSPDDISVPNNCPPAIPPRNPKRSVQVVTQSQRLRSTNTREVTATHSDAALPNDIEQYSIEDVSKALKLLRLEKYIPAFTAMVIDGRMLRKLDETILKNELHLTRIEAMRLMDFVKNGHVSK
ncbi:hypothetical protein ACJMK2_003738 [Sinanodonta woodiana]|uniref:SAM domain-containing protein n=1 Tax=Sinanodonta woodiana TaxID=1069815 RepID=A0ABD3Y0P6_SINWO